MKEKYLTTNQAVPITDNQNSLTVGERGPVLLQDVQFIEKMAHFDRERIPERVVHAKGAGGTWLLSGFEEHGTLHQGEIPPRSREKDTCIFTVFNGHRRKRFC